MIGTVLPQDEFLGETIRDQLIYFPTVTREFFRNRGRITDLIASGELCRQLGLPLLNSQEDRVMMCGSPGLLQSTRALLEARGFREGTNAEPGHFSIEKAFVET